MFAAEVIARHDTCLGRPEERISHAHEAKLTFCPLSRPLRAISVYSSFESLVCCRVADSNVAFEGREMFIK